MDADDDHRTITTILALAAGELPLSLLEQVTTEDVVCHMDRVTLNVGRSGLRTWFRYMHATTRKRRISIEIDIDSIEMIEPGRYDVSGTVATTHQNGRTEANRFAVTYGIENGKVTTVWTTRSNYVGVVGRSIRLPLHVGFMYHCLRARYCNA